MRKQVKAIKGGKRDKKSKPSFGMISLGCAKNLVDAESIAGRAAGGDFPFCFDAMAADVVVVNTCSFIADAVEESMAEIAAQVARKEAGECRAVVVTGCLPSRLGPRGRPEGVDGWFCVGEGAKVAAFLESMSEQACPAAVKPSRAAPRAGRRLFAETGRFRFTPPHFAYLRVTEGCDNRCSYCTIPSIRGGLRVKPLSQIMIEARELAASGAREIVLIGQDTTAWSGAAGGISRVIESVAGVSGVEWVRLMYAHPARADDDLVRTLSAGPPVLPYLDLPVQHGSDRILKAMNRRTTAAAMLSFIGRLRDRAPEVAIRTTVMTGFPGETGEDFKALVKFVEKAGFERMGAFSWSPEDGTPAAGLKGRVPSRTAGSRLARILELGESLRDAFHERRVGSRCDAVVDLGGPDGSLARTWAEAPEVDPVVILPEEHEQGSVLGIEIEGLAGPDMTGGLRLEAAAGDE